MENRIIMYLAGKLRTTVVAEVPEDIPTKFVVVDKLGGNSKEHISSIRVAVQSYDSTKSKTSKLNNEVIEAMNEMVNEINVSNVTFENSYPFNDISRKRYRYQAIFNITYC